MNELDRLHHDLKENEELQKKFEEEKSKQAQENKSDLEILINASNSLGYKVTESELEKALAELQELSEDELGLVSGGTTGTDEYGHDLECWTIWHCFATFCHTETYSHRVNCWTNYLCACDSHSPEYIAGEYHLR